MSIARITILMAVFVLAVLPSWASDNKTFKLKDIIDEGLSNNPEIKASKERWEAAKATKSRSGSLEDPLLSVMFDKIPDSSMNPGESMERLYSITQEFPFPGKLTTMEKMAGKEAEMMFEEYRGKERDIVRDIKNAYYAYFMINKSIEVSRETKEILHHLSKIAEARYATGLVSQWDVLKAQIELSQLANEIVILDREMDTAKARLNLLLNRDVDTPIGVPVPINSRREIPSYGLLLERALQERPELKGMERFIEKEQTGLDLAKKGYYPDFMVKLGQWEEDGNRAGWIAEFGVKIPLWFGTKQDSAIKESISRLDSAKSEYIGMKNMVSFEIKDAVSRIRSAKSLVDLHKSTHIPAAEQALKGARIGYETGKLDFFALMESWKTVKSYKLDYYKAEAALEQAWADLERAIGRELP